MKEERGKRLERKDRFHREGKGLRLLPGRVHPGLKDHSRESMKKIKG